MGALGVSGGAPSSAAVHPANPDSDNPGCPLWALWAAPHHSGAGRNPEVFARRRSLCLAVSGFRPAPEYPCCIVKGFSGCGGVFGHLGVPRRATALTCSNSFRITATSAAFLALPR